MDNQLDKQMTDFLDGVVGAVEANSYECHSLWGENRRREWPLKWVENLSGLTEIVGTVNDMPVCLTLWTAEIDNHKILFFDATSQLVDHRMIDKWLEETLPKTAFRDDGYVNRTDAMNFTNVFPRRKIT